MRTSWRGGAGTSCRHQVFMPVQVPQILWGSCAELFLQSKLKGIKMKYQGRIKLQTATPYAPPVGTHASSTINQHMICSPRGALVGIVYPSGTWPHLLSVVLDSPKAPDAPSYMHWDGSIVQLQIAVKNTPTGHAVPMPVVAHEATHAALFMVKDFEQLPKKFNDWCPRWPLTRVAAKREETVCWVVERIVAAVGQYALANQLAMDYTYRTNEFGVIR